MFFDVDLAIGRLAQCLVGPANGSVVKKVLGASEFESAFDGKGDCPMPTIYVVPSTMEFVTRGRTGSSSQCSQYRLVDRIDFITVTDCANDSARAYLSTRQNRLIRAEYFCCLLDWPGAPAVVGDPPSVDTLPPEYELMPVNGGFIRQRDQEYWWQDSWTVTYNLKECS